MQRFVEGEDRQQIVLLPPCLDDYVTENNPVRVIEAFVDELDLATLGFEGVVPEATGRPSYHPSTLLKIYVYGYLNRVQSSRRLEREAQRNVEVMWLTGRLTPDFKTMPTSGRTTAMRSARCAPSSSCCAGGSSCSPSARTCTGVQRRKRRSIASPLSRTARRFTSTGRLRAQIATSISNAPRLQIDASTAGSMRMFSRWSRRALTALPKPLD